MQATAVILKEPKDIELQYLTLDEPVDGDVIVEIDYSGVSAGTERLIWSGDMPNFPGMGFPLVPGYEAIGRVVDARGSDCVKTGEPVFVPGAKCFGAVRGLFGAAASRLVVEGKRLVSLSDMGDRGEDGILIALAATAHHAIARGGVPDLIIGHGVLGRLAARISVALGGEPVVWEREAARMSGAEGYSVITAAEDNHKNYQSVLDLSGDAATLDKIISRLTRGGHITLAGFYSAPLTFNFAPAFMREVTIKVASEWTRADLVSVATMAAEGSLSLAGLITHTTDARNAAGAYRTAFSDPECLKMVLDWRDVS